MELSKTREVVLDGTGYKVMIKNITISVVLLLIAWKLKIPLISVSSNANVIPIVSILIQISAVLSGFIITAYSILLSISDKPIIKNMTNSGHYKYLLKLLVVASVLFSLNFITGLYLLFTEPLYQIVFIGLVFSFLTALVFFFDAARLFLILISNVDS